jgi:hypothetical protein
MAENPANFDPPVPAPKSRRRRWFQFSLRTLMIFTVICAVACGWLGKKIARKHKEIEAVEAITNLGGGACYDYQRVSGKPGHWQKAEPYGPAWLRELLGEHFFSEVDCIDASGGLEHLKDLPNLPELRLIGPRVTNAGLENVRGLTRLQTLALEETKISDAGLPNLKTLTNLQTLDLSGTNVTEAGVKDLKKALPNCKIYH